MKTTEWNNCYPSNWKGVITPEAMSHPAKYSSKLIRRIYEHMIEMDWLKPGDDVLDPFGGVALGALDAMRLGMNWTGIELEEKFYRLGWVNILSWLDKYRNFPHWGSARLLHGDSRKLVEIIQGQVSAAVSSPPYADAIQTSEKGSGIDYTKGKDGSMKKTVAREAIAVGYGSAPGQLGAMKAGDFDAAISSPPFLQSEGGTGERAIPKGMDAALMARHAAGNKSANGYGASDGQLSSMKDGCFEVAVSSPPFEKTVLHDGGPALQQGGQLHSDYGSSLGQLGNDSGNDFWISARTIVEQVYLSLAPGGHAVWVVKDYVKNKQIVPFSDQWRQLCEAVGFVTEHEHRAMLVHHKGSQHTLEGGMVEKKTESKSFFRRLAEKKGSPRIDWETVYCMVKS